MADQATCAGKKWLATLRPGQSVLVEIGELIEAIHDTLAPGGVLTAQGGSHTFAPARTITASRTASTGGGLLEISKG
jgi:hypothetical protein